MSRAVELFPKENADSARITMTNEHTVINGAHYKISNGYLHKHAVATSVATKDILSIERQKLRNKRLLVIGLVLFGLLLLIPSAFSMINRAVFINNLVSGDEAAIAELQRVYLRYVIFGNMEIIGEVLDSADSLYTFADRTESTIEALDGDLPVSSSLNTTRNVLYVILFIPSAVCVGMYTLKPVLMLRIKAMGGDFAVETRYYTSETIDGLIGAYYD